MKLSLFKEGARTRAEVESLRRQMPPPGVSVFVGKNEKEAFDLDARAGRQQLFQSAGARGREAFEGGIDDMNALMSWQLIQQFKDGALRR